MLVVVAGPVPHAPSEPAEVTSIRRQAHIQREQTSSPRSDKLRAHGTFRVPVFESLNGMIDCDWPLKGRSRKLNRPENMLAN